MRRFFVYPYVLWITMFIAAPLLLVLYYALTATGPDGQIIFTFAQFRMFFTGLTPGEPFFSRLYVRIAVHSVRMAVQTTVICFILIALVISYNLKYFRNCIISIAYNI